MNNKVIIIAASLFFIAQASAVKKPTVVAPSAAPIAATATAVPAISHARRQELGQRMDFSQTDDQGIPSLLAIATPLAPLMAPAPILPPASL